MNKGFTLVEVLGVIIILSGIMLVAIPAYNNVAASVKKSSLDNKTKAIASSMEKFANKYLIDQIKPAGETCTSDSCCKRYDLYTYIVEYGIYAAEETSEDGVSITDPVTNDKLYGCVEVRYDAEKFTIKSKFIKDKIVAGEADCG